DWGSGERRRGHLPRLASGECIGAFAAAEGGTDAAPDAPRTRFEAGRLHGEKLPVLDGESADLCVVVARGAAGPTLFLVDLHGPGVARAPLASFDPSRAQARIAFDGAAAEALGPADRAAASPALT